MKFTLSTLLATAGLLHSASAHYCFNRLIVNDNITSEYEYVRKNNNSNSPVTAVNSTDLRCNAGGLLTGSTTKTHAVKAGDTVGFALDTAIGHPGPVQVYMSKADSTAKEYDGAGEWFKIYELGTSDITDEGLQWATDQITNFTFALPAKLPSGEYLLRAESIALHGASTYGGAQFYISCAQISVEGTATEAPAGDFVAKIPGVYTGNEPGIMLNIYYPVPTNYTMPGPAIWPAGSEAHAAVFVGESAAASAASTPSATTPAAAAATSAVNVAAALTPISTPTPAAYSAPAYSAPAAYSTPAAYSPVYTPVYTPGATPGASSGGAVQVYGQCGGSNYQGSTTCVSGATCQRWNDYYSQCVAGSA